MSFKICLISREYPPESAFGGIARAEEIEARALARAGADVHVITYSPRGRFTRQIQDGVVVHRLPAMTPGVPADMHYVVAGAWSRTVGEYYRALDAVVGFDLIRAQDYFAETLHLERRPVTRLVARLHALSGVVSERSGRVRHGGDRGLEALEAAALTTADLLLGPTQQVIDETRRFVGERTPETRLLPLGMDFERFAPRAGERREGPLRALFLGRLEPLKGPELALHAAAAAKAAGVELQLTLVGRDVDGYRVGTLVPLMRELGLDFGDVRFVAQVDEAGVLQHLANADCAILPSRFENFHMAAVEALACGVPVITSDRNGLAGWLDSQDGLIALPIEEPAAFGAQAAEALADSDWVAGAGARAAQRVRELFDADRVVAQQLEIYKELCGSATPAAPVTAADKPAGKLGIVVLAHNALDYTKRCLTSILRHTDADFTVYLVDNASTDATPDWVGGLDPRVRLLRSEENLGVSGGRNVGIAAALADGVDYVVFLDNDVEVYAGWCHPFLMALEAHPDAGIAGERGVRLHFHADGRNEETINGAGPQQADMVVGFCMVMRAGAVRQIGRFDENLGLFWHDDDDYCLRAKRLGYGVLHIGSGRLIHFEHKSSAEVDGIWESADANAPSALSAQNQRYLATKWHGDQRREGIEGARSFVALAFADEVIAAPDLLAAWGRTFNGSDDATLAIYTGDTPADQLVGRLEAAVSEAGLSGDDAPDLVIVQGGEQIDVAVAGSTDAVLTNREPQGTFQAPPHFDASMLDALRALAERRFAAAGALVA